MTNGRNCGDCIACCTYLKSKAVPMDGLAHCAHSKLVHPPNEDELIFKGSEDCSVEGCGNCAIYEDRPKACVEYKCLWLMGYGEEEDRPDLSGVLVDTILPIENCIQAKPIWENAQDSEKGRWAIENISGDTNKPAAVAGYPETKMVRIVGRGFE